MFGARLGWKTSWLLPSSSLQNVRWRGKLSSPFLLDGEGVFEGDAHPEGHTFDLTPSFLATIAWFERTMISARDWAHPRPCRAAAEQTWCCGSDKRIMGMF